MTISTSGIRTEHHCPHCQSVLYANETFEIIDAPALAVRTTTLYVCPRCGYQAAPANFGLHLWHALQQEADE